MNDVKEIPVDFEIEETGKTFAANAILKARGYGKMSGLLTLADDSGLEVDALGGQPGVYSSRWAPTAQERNKKLLREMADVPDEKRGAQYRGVVAIYDPDTDKIRTCEAVCRGEISRQPQGAGGFDYDPIFYKKELGKTYAQLSMSEKNSISHRSQNINRARKILQEEFI